MATSSEDQAHWAPNVKEELARSGIAMDIQRVEWSAYLKRVRNAAVTPAR